MSEDMKNALDWLNEIITNPNGWRMFYSDSETKTCAEATLELLKEQEAVKPETENDGTPGDFACWWYVCGNCGRDIDPGDRYCRHCGRAVNWNDNDRY